MTATLVATPDPDDGPSKTADPDWEEFVEAHSPDKEYDLVELFKYRRRHYWDELEQELSPEFIDEVEIAMEKMSDTGKDFHREPRTGAERYFAKRMEDPEYAAGYWKVRKEIDTVICDRGIKEQRISWS